jgi:hypothetical protein
MKRRFEVLAIASVVLLALAGPVAADCVGDCDGGGTVVVSELITGINIALGTAEVSACPSFDADDSGDVTVAELITAINNALTGCPAGGVCGDGTTDPGEECDDGGICMGDPNATACISSTECPEGQCEPVGGDGCAENCTLETKFPCILSAEAGATLQTTLFGVPLPITGRQDLRVGKATASSGEIPVVIRVDEMLFDPVSVPGLVCACARGGVKIDLGPGNAARGYIGCGQQGLAEVSYFAPIDHNTNNTDPNCENGELEFDVQCVGGACQGGTRDKDTCKKDSECTAVHLGVCNSKIGLEFTGGGPRGSMFLQSMNAISLIQDGGACAKDCTIKNAGPDCLPCTPDDLNQAEPKSMPLTTGVAEGAVFDANNQLGPPARKIVKGSGTPCAATAECIDPEKCWNFETSELCLSGDSGCECQRICGGGSCTTQATGHVVDCALLAGDPEHAMSGSSLGGALSSVDSQSLGDNVVTVVFACE